MSCLYSAVSLSWIREWRFLPIIIIIIVVVVVVVKFPPRTRLSLSQPCRGDLMACDQVNPASFEPTEALSGEQSVFQVKMVTVTSEELAYTLDVLRHSFVA